MKPITSETEREEVSPQLAAQTEFAPCVLGSRPLVFACAFYLLGILYAALARPPLLWTLAAAFVFVLAYIPARRVRYAGLLLLFAVLCAGMTMFSSAVEAPFQPQVGRDYTVEGRVAEMRTREDGEMLYRLTGATIDGEAYAKGIFLRCADADARLNDVLQAEASLRLPTQPRYPHGFDDQLYCASKSVGLRAYAQEAAIVGKAADVWTAVDDLRYAIAGRMEELFGSQAEVAKAMLIGMSWELDDSLQEGYRETGMAHVLVVSGLHVAVVAGLVFWLLRLLRLGRHARFWVAALCVLAYIALAGRGTSVVRAGVMCLIGLVGDYTRQRKDALTMLAAALFIVLLLNPAQAFDVGCQLSFAAVFSILCLSGRFARLFRWMGKTLCGAASATLAASVGTLPLLINLSNRYWLPSVLLNMVVVLLPGVLLPCIALATLLYAVFGSPVSFLGAAVTWMLEGMSGLSRLAELLPGLMVEIASVSGLFVLLYYAGVFLLSGYVKVAARVRAAAAACTAAVMIFTCLPIGEPAADVRIDFLDVGAADAAVIITRSGACALIDTGKPTSGVLDYLQKQGIYPNMTFISHADSDHAGGLAGLVEGGRAGQVYATAGECAQVAQLGGCEAKGCVAGDVVPLGEEAELVVLYPFDNAVLAESNANSLVLLLRVCGENACLFMGDATTAVEYRLKDAQACILKVGHHGSKTSTANSFVQRTGAQYAIISADGPPDERVCEALAGTTVVNTLHAGRITAYIGREIAVEGMYE